MTCGLLPTAPLISARMQRTWVTCIKQICLELAGRQQKAAGSRRALAAGGWALAAAAATQAPSPGRGAGLHLRAALGSLQTNEGINAGKHRAVSAWGVACTWHLFQGSQRQLIPRNPDTYPSRLT